MAVYAVKWDPALCTGCQACMVACMDQNDIDPSLGELPFCRVSAAETGQGFAWEFAVCIHCDEPACVSACRAGCLYKDTDTGLVLYDADRCMACGSCVRACREQAIVLDRNHRIAKCDGCIQRIRAGLAPACVKVCRSGALHMEKANAAGNKGMIETRRREV